MAVGRVRRPGYRGQSPAEEPTNERREVGMDTVGVGVVGCGFVGRGAHVPAFATIEGSRLAAIADADEKRLNKVAKKYQVPSAYQDYRGLLDDPAVQLVVVATPTPLHAQVSLDAIQAGKHVLCEMPLAPTLDEAEKLIDAAQAAGVVLMPSLTFRFTPTFTKVKELIEAGEIGTPVAATYREWIPASDLARQWPAGGWMWDVPKSGGPLYTLSVWSLDLLRWLFAADIADVHASTGYHRLDTFGGTLGYNSVAAIRMVNGVVVELNYSGSVAAAASSNWFEVVGDSTGVIHAESNESVTLMADSPAKTEWQVKAPGPKMWGHEQQDAYLIRCLREGQQPDLTPADGRRAMEIALEIA
jgi:predicted dehydrogenase